MHASKLNQEAVSRFSQSYTKLLTDDFFGQNTHITGQQIISLSPIKQVNFFILKVLFDQWQEEAKKFKSPYFDYDNAEVRQSLKTLSNILSKNIKVAKPDIVPLVEKSVEDTLRMMYDPKSYFIEALKKMPQVDITNEFKSAVKYFKLYRDLIDTLIDNIEKSVSKDITILESLIRNTVEGFDFDEGELEEVEGLFNATLVLDVFEKSTPVQGEKTVVETALKSEEEMNFFDSLEDDEEVIPAKPKRVPETVVEVEPKKRKVRVADTKPTAEVNGLPLLRKEEEPEGSKSLNDQFAEVDVKTLNDKFEEEEKPKNIATLHEEKSISELASSINLNQRYMFVNDLFEGNESDYNKALIEIDKSDSFDSSVELLVQNYSKKYMWDMNSDEVKELLKIIFKRFR